MSTPVTKLLYSAFRIAGITDRPGRTPATEQLGDAIDLANRMLSSWNIQRLRINDISINAYPLAAQKVFTFGGASVTATNLSATRPARITRANIIDQTGARFPVGLLEPEDWAAITVQDQPNTLPWSLYYDQANPIANLYLYGQPVSTYQLELYTWHPIGALTLTAAVDLPEGYELAFTFNLAVLIAAAFPTQAQLSPDSRRIAKDALRIIEGQNAPAPRLKCDFGTRRGRSSNYYAFKGNSW